MPDIDDGAGDRLAVGIAHLPVHEQHLALLGAVIQLRFTLGKRRAGNVERALDGARRAAFQAGAALGLVQTQVEEGLQAKAGHQQSDLVGLAEHGQVAHGRPELVRLHIEILDGAEQVGDHALHDLLQPRIALVVVQAADPVHQCLHGLRIQ